MKRLLLLVLFCFIMVLSVSAKSGDIAGKYYSTDIVTTLNGVEIDSINIGGQTLISAEDMYYYSFDVTWNANERTLSVKSVKHAENGVPPKVEKNHLPSGSVLGNYYETDIVTFLDGTPITAYNIGGRTYIHAEEMRDFNYEVIWDADKRSLSITSPDRAGYPSSIKLSKGIERSDKNDNGIGAFSITYTKDGIMATDDADCFDMSMYRVNGEFHFNMSFYQNYRQTGNLISKLDAVVYHGMESSPESVPPKMYEAVNKLIKISINGHTAREVTIIRGSGNGHVDFRIIVSDLPNFRMTEIEEIKVSIGEVHGEPYKVIFPEKEVDIAEKAVLKNPYDFVKYNYQAGDFSVVIMRESKSLGAVTDRIYVVNRKTGECSHDVLDKVRAIDGFYYETFVLYGFNFADNNEYFRFSVFLDDRTADFNMRIDNAYVELLAQTKRD